MKAVCVCVCGEWHYLLKRINTRNANNFPFLCKQSRSRGGIASDILVDC
jgi:hypothetical protein